MIVDSSAVIAILRDEADAASLAAALVAADRVAMSAANWLEAAVVVDSSGDPRASRHYDELIRLSGIEIVPVTAEQAEVARQAYRDFGRRSRSRAQLNFGDCFAYALATVAREPLLFTGDDFVHTDVTPASHQPQKPASGLGADPLHRGG